MFNLYLLGYPNRLITISLEESFFFWRFNVADNNKTLLGVRLLCQILNKFEVWQVFVKVSDIKFHANPSKWEPCWYMQRDGRTHTDGRDEGNKLFFSSRRMCLKVKNLDFYITELFAQVCVYLPFQFL